VILFFCSSIPNFIIMIRVILIKDSHTGAVRKKTTVTIVNEIEIYNTSTNKHS
jgi:hypothetical protein